MGAFHAYDIRGIYNKDFDKDTVYRIGFFLPELLKTDRILVGRDCRVSSPEIFNSLLEGITDAGADVYNAALTTTPMIYFGTGRFDFKASVQITASHNSKEYNGLKISGENVVPVGYATGLSTLEEWITGRVPLPSSRKGQVKEINIRDEYISFLKQFKRDLTGLTVGMDLSNGMASLLIKDILNEEGDVVHYLFDDMDGTFPNHDPNPLVAENIIALQQLVKERGCDIGVIYDGDADRVMFVDENGKFISPDLMIAFMGHYFLEELGKRGPVLQDIRSSKAVGEYLTPMGAEMHTWRVGRAFAALKLKEINGIYGGELAGHYYFKDFFYSDSGIMASLIILGVLKRFKNEGRSLSSVISEIERYQNSGEINFKIEEKQEAMDLIRDYFTSKEEAIASYDFDGYRVEFEDWWFNIRPSNTEPYLRFIAEAKDKELLKTKIDKVKELLNQ